MPTRPDVQEKRDATYRLQTRDAKRMHARAGDLERQAATLAHTITAMQAQQISLMLEAALLRRDARAK